MKYSVEFLRAYLETALFQSIHQGRTIDEEYDINNFSIKAMQQARKDCTKFILDNADTLGNLNLGDKRYSAHTVAGSLFWTSRHYNDGGFIADRLGEAGEALHDSARTFTPLRVVPIGKHLEFIER